MLYNIELLVKESTWFYRHTDERAIKYGKGYVEAKVDIEINATAPQRETKSLLSNYLGPETK